MASIPWPPGENLQSLLICLGDTLAQVNCAAGNLTIESVSQAELDAAAAAYYADVEKYLLAPTRENRKRFLRNLSHANANRAYPPERRELFSVLLTEAIIHGLENRVTDIRQLASWAKTVAAAQITAEAQVDAASSRDEIRAVEIDFEPIKAADPMVTIKGALSILD